MDGRPTRACGDRVGRRLERLSGLTGEAQLALGWLDREILTEEARLGGDAETVWRKNGKEPGEVEDLLELQRARRAS